VNNSCGAPPHDRRPIDAPPVQASETGTLSPLSPTTVDIAPSPDAILAFATASLADISTEDHTRIEQRLTAEPRE
jgi:hypothetical protein